MRGIGRGMAVLALVLGACAQQREPGSWVNGVPYPHPSDWKATHGAAAMSQGSEGCLPCHERASASSGPQTPACTSCHPSYPHASTWADPAVHGGYVTAPTVVQTQCTLCHGPDLRGGATKVGCASCHPLYPHGPAWSDPAVHGTWVIDNGGRAQCSPCHGSDLKGGFSGVSCTQCHALYPHPGGWEAPSAHGAFVRAQGSAACRECHGQDYAGGGSRVSCFTCHPSYPHAIDWMTAQDGSHPHADFVRASGDASCRDCHVDIKAPAKLDVFGFPQCQYCHGS